MKHKQVSIVQLEPNDWHKYKNIRLESLREEPKAFHSTFEEESRHPNNYWQERLTNKNDIFVFATHEDQVVGIMNLSFREEGETDSVAVVHDAYVSKEFRGLGVGKALLNSLIGKVSSDTKIKMLKLWVKEYQTSALKLYTGLGFKLIEKVGEHTLVMEKKLE